MSDLFKGPAGQAASTPVKAQPRVADTIDPAVDAATSTLKILGNRRRDSILQRMGAPGRGSTEVVHSIVPKTKYSALDVDNKGNIGGPGTSFAPPSRPVRR